MDLGGLVRNYWKRWGFEMGFLNILGLEFLGFGLILRRMKKVGFDLRACPVSCYFFE